MSPRNHSESVSVRITALLMLPTMIGFWGMSPCRSNWRWGSFRPFQEDLINSLPVPLRWLRDVAPGITGSVTAIDDGCWSIRVGGERLSYDSTGIERQQQRQNAVSAGNLEPV